MISRNGTCFVDTRLLTLFDPFRQTLYRVVVDLQQQSDACSPARALLMTSLKLNEV